MVVYDTRGEAEGLTTADWLASQGFEVTYLTSGNYPGWRIDPMTRQMILERLVEGKVEVVTSSEVTALTDAGITVWDNLNQRTRELEGIATVVAAVGNRPRDGFVRHLAGAATALEVSVVGDAYAPRRIEGAIFDGHLAARHL